MKQELNLVAYEMPVVAMRVCEMTSHTMNES
jgi:hypothetical protein